MNTGDLTLLLNRARAGDAQAAEAAFTQVYGELKRIAQSALGRQGAQTLSATALVHEAYVKLFDGIAAQLQDRGHFFRLCARAMRQIVVDHARRRQADKRGGALVHTALSENVADAADRSHDILAIDQALETLRARDERLAVVVEAHFFGGMTFGEIGRELGLAERTVRLDWQTARAVLLRSLGPAPAP